MKRACLPEGGKRPVAVVVDAYSTAAHLAPELARRGIACVHVQSSADLPDALLRHYQAEDFLENIVHDGDLSRVLSRLRAHDVRYVLTGAETGVLLGDALSEALGLPGNRAATAMRRRDKFHMGDALARAGLRAARQLKSSCVEEVLRWCGSEASGGWPVVLKPLHSSGTDGVTICSSRDEVRQAFSRIHGRENRLHLVNEEVLAQSFLPGDEYVVNTVSWKGEPQVIEIWRVHKRRLPGAASIYDYEDLLTLRGPTQEALGDYAGAVLAALGVEYGPAHLEIMMTPEGPTLIELGARLQGSTDPAAIVACLGTNQLLATVDAYTRPAAFAARRSRGGELQRFGRVVALIAEQTGMVDWASMEAEIRRLPSFFSLHLRVQPGERTMRTVDLFTSPGDVRLVHPDREVVQRDTQRVREIEKRSPALREAAS